MVKLYSHLPQNGKIQTISMSGLHDCGNSCACVRKNYFLLGKTVLKIGKVYKISKSLCLPLFFYYWGKRSDACAPSNTSIPASNSSCLTASPEKKTVEASHWFNCWWF